MGSLKFLSSALLFTALFLPNPAVAHAFGRSYNLPLPYWMYINAAVAALVVSFILVAVFSRSKTHSGASQQYAFGNARWLNVLRKAGVKVLLQAFSVGVLLLCIVSGFIGNADPYRNINMTAFWIVFYLGGTYAVAILGNHYAWLNPWRIIVMSISKLWSGLARGRWAYPKKLSYYPALLIYLLFISVELFENVRPRSLSEYLLGYTVFTLFMTGLWGAKSWFRYGEFFAVFMHLVGKVAPVKYNPQGQGANRWVLRWPFSGLDSGKPMPMSLVLFVLFMLSSTAFDGLRATTPWFKLFWTDQLGIITPLIGEHPIRAYVQLRPWYIGFEVVSLIISPLIYLAGFMFFLWLGRVAEHKQFSVAQLARLFAPSLIPIAVVYHATHYYTLLQTEGVKIRALISDPFGRGWDLFGTALTMRRPYIPDMGVVWASQVWLILFGHVVAVVLAHRLALRLSSGKAAAAASQLPMLLLMTALTASGLWILAQPLQGR